MSSEVDWSSFEIQPPKPSKESQGDFSKYELRDKPSRLRSILSAFPKGVLKEARQQLVNTPLLGSGLESLQGTGIAKTDEQIEDILNKVLPTQEDKFIERGLERGGRIAPYAAVGGGNLAAQGLKSVLGGLAGEGAKDLGAPPLVQALTEIAAMGAPSLGKKIVPTAKQAPLVEGARNLGLSEKEIAPLIQGEGKQKFLAKAAPKRGRTQAALQRSKGALGEVYGRLAGSETAQAKLSQNDASQVVDSINDVLEKLPSGVRKTVHDDFMDLIKEGVSGSSLINFYQDLNHYIGKGERQLGLLKDPIQKGLSKISPQLGEDFALTNKLYGNYSKLASRLKPNLVGDLLQAGRGVRIAFGITMGNFPLLAETMTESAAKNLAKEMLINPRFQNLGKQMASALNHSKWGVAKKIADSMGKEVKKIDPSVAKQLEEIDFNSLQSKERIR